MLAAAQGRPAFIPMDLVPTLYAGYPEAVYQLAAMTVQSHLEKLVRDGRIDRVDTGNVDSPPRFLARRG